MNRRSFLQSLLAVPALALVLVKKPEPALCKCGKPMPADQARLTPEDFQARYIQPMAAALAAQIDAEAIRAYTDVNRQMDEWYTHKINRRYDEVFIASGGQGYVIKVRPPKRYAVSKLSNPEVW